MMVHLRQTFVRTHLIHQHTSGIPSQSDKLQELVAERNRSIHKPPNKRAKQRQAQKHETFYQKYTTICNLFKIF
jgi:hypothetical protein